MSDSNRNGSVAPLVKQGNGTDRNEQSASGNNQFDTVSNQRLQAVTEQSPIQNASPISQEKSFTERPAQYQLSDLAAQQTMAEASLWMAFAAIGTMIVTGIGTLFLARQVRLTRKAVEDTGNATDAMIRQNELTEHAQRPWLTLELEYGFSNVDRGEGDFTEMLLFSDLKITNIGGIPARNVSVHEVPIPEVIRNETHDLEIISDNLAEQFDGLEKMIVFPNSTETRQIIYSAPYESFAFSSGSVARPDVLVVVNYRLADGTPAQTSARFIIYNGAEGQYFVAGDAIDGSQALAIKIGYVRAT